MGDRANVFCVEEGGDNPKGVYLYTHWGGSDLPLVVKAALARKQRWNDGQYLTRIIFSEMIKDDVDGETGYGISANIGDNSHSVVVVDSENCTVGFSVDEPNCYVQWTMSEFIELSDEEILKHYNKEE